MSKTYKDLFGQLNKIEPSIDLGNKIYTSVLVYEKRKTRIRLAMLSIISFVSLAFAIPVFTGLISNIAKSGLYQYATLIFSDGGMLALYWKEFVLSLAESIPLFGTIVFLSVFTIFLWSSSKAIRTARFVLSTT